MITLSKSQFKSQMLEYLREVESKGIQLIITHEGNPVATVLPYKEDPDAQLVQLRGSVMKYTEPDTPTGLNDWEVLQ
ncbi:MAG: hypothetical protein KatS3mg087_0294 [Patescibacteria group bacterium]|nr:MAG: hypothetical protein KatS3mg087_0294 [Patescibacteria group bacterium]